MNETVKVAANGRRSGRRPDVSSPLVMEIAQSTPDEALARLDANRAGLSEEQVEERRERYGLNEITQEKPASWYVQLFHAFLTPFNGVLAAVSIVSLFTDVILACLLYTSPSPRD